MTDYPVPTRPVLRGEVVDEPPPVPRSTMDLLDWISYLMDRCYELPGTRVRVGFNSLFLLVPVLGDVLPTLISTAILVIGLSHYRVPRIVATRMVFNSLLDASISWVPVLGNLWDVYFKADTRNIRLLREYVDTKQALSPTWHHWAFVFGVLAVFLLVIVLLVLGAIALVQWLARTLHGTPG